MSSSLEFLRTPQVRSGHVVVGIGDIGRAYCVMHLPWDQVSLLCSSLLTGQPCGPFKCAKTNMIVEVRRLASSPRDNGLIMEVVARPEGDTIVLPRNHGDIYAPYDRTTPRTEFIVTFTPSEHTLNLCRLGITVANQAGNELGAPLAT